MDQSNSRVALFGIPDNVQFHDAWVHFGQIADELSISRIGKTLYGLQVYPPTFPAKFEFTYMACNEKVPDIEVPIRMLTKTIPRCTYVVQRVVGGVDVIALALQYIYREYIPKNGLKVAMPLDFENYPSIKNQGAFDGDIEVWVPIDGHMRSEASSKRSPPAAPSA